METDLKNDLASEMENFRDIHALQYDRIGKLEAQENFVSTFVYGFSTVTIAISFVGEKPLNFVTGLCLPVIFVAANLIASAYIDKTRKFVKLHQERAAEMRKAFSPKLQEILASVKKTNSVDDIFRKRNQMRILHYLIASIGLFISLKYIFDSYCPCK